MHEQTTVLLLSLFLIRGTPPISNSKAFQESFLIQHFFFPNAVYWVLCFRFPSRDTYAKSTRWMRLGSWRGDTPEYFEIKHSKNSQVAIKDQIHGHCWASLEHRTQQQHQKTKITTHKTRHYQNASFQDAATKVLHELMCCSCLPSLAFQSTQRPHSILLNVHSPPAAGGSSKSWL